MSFDSRGLKTLAYNGVVLEDTTVYTADSFHIWHMKATDLSGNVLSSGQYGWGESNNGTTWNSQTLTETYCFTWGSISTQFVQNGNTLNLVVTETNYANSGILFDGAEIFPFSLHFPQDPAGFHGLNQYAITTTDPGVSTADFGSGVVTAVLPDESRGLYTGWKAQGAATYSPIMTSTAPDGIATFLPHNDLPLAPGKSLTYTVSLRFTPEGTAADVTDALASFAQTYPSQFSWADKRIIGTAFLASSPVSTGDKTLPGGYPTNPRRYFTDASVDVTTPAGLKSFQNRILTQAANQVVNAKDMNAQGVITWDLEGEQYPQDTSYVCSPDQVATIAPEMETIVLDTGSAFYGQKLDDAYFKTMTNAGLKVGLCLRPQVFTPGANGTASQQFLSTNAAIIANLENKARVANSRWGATLFYVDSVVDSNGGTLDPAIFQQLSSDLPGLLFIPEEFTTRYYAYTAPFYSFIFHGTTGTASSVYGVYPAAFGVNMVNDVNSALLAQYTPQLTTAVSKGDILLGHADYWQENDPTLVAIYAAAGITGPRSTAPTLTWTSPAAIGFGESLSSTQLNASANVAGTFTYAPSAGSILPAGTHTLTATFTPVDTSAYSSASITVQLTVAQATPIVSWPTPARIAAGVALSAAQLDATASVPGSFTYSPAAGSVLASGNNVLSATFTPTDSTDYKVVTATTNLDVAAPLPIATALRAVVANPTVTYGAPVTVSLTVSPMTITTLVPSGTVACSVGSLNLGSAPLNDGATEFSTTALPAGTDRIRCTYFGDSTFAPSSAASDVVVAAPGYASSISLPAQTFAPGALTSPLVASVTYTGPAPSAAVIFQVDGGLALNAACNVAMGGGSMNCAVQYPTAHLAAGAHQLIVSAMPDGTYPLAQATASLTPGATKPMIAITVPAQSADAGTGSVNVRATGTFQSGVFPTGTVVVMIDGANPTNAACSLTSYASADCVAQLPTPGMAVGEHAITVYIAGDSAYSTSTGTGTLTVR